MTSNFFFKIRIWISHLLDIQVSYHNSNNNVYSFYYKTHVQRDEIIVYKLHVLRLVLLKLTFVLF